MQEFVDKLKEKKFTIGSVESMTGGLFASSLTSVPGASKVFKGSVVSYSPEIKVKVVGVNKNTIDTFNVVSKQVAEEMATKGLTLLDVDICVSVTGNAGPTSEPGKAGVGEVYIGVANKQKCIVVKKIFSGDRDEIRKKTLLAMQEEVLQLI